MRKSSVIPEKPKKVIVFVNFLILDKFLHAWSSIGVLDRLSELDYDVYMTALRSRKSSKNISESIRSNKTHFILVPLRYIPLITSFLFALANLIMLPFLTVLKRPKFIIIQPGPEVACFVWKPILYLLKCKIILDIRSTPVELVGLRGFLKALSFSVSVYAAKTMFDGIITITAGMRDELSESYNIGRDFIKVRTSAVSTSIFNPELYDGAETRRRFGLVNKFIIFYHGDFGIYRGLLDTIKTIELVSSSIDDIVLFLLGSGPAIKSIRDLIEERKLQEKVIIHDPVPPLEVPKYIAMCDVGIVPLPNIPDWRNQCPLKLLEYLAMKKVAIVTDIPANREVLGESQCGIYISSIRPSEIKRGIIHAYNNRGKLTEWGSEGRSIIIEKFSWERTAKVLDENLTKLDNPRTLRDQYASTK